MKLKSSCCYAEVKVVGGAEGTNHYECTKCHKACDVFGEATTASDMGYATTTTWTRNDTFVSFMRVRNRFYVAMMLLLTGKLKIAWEIPTTKHDKRLKLIGKRLVAIKRKRRKHDKANH